MPLLKVLHIENPAGVASSIRDAQRKMGTGSDVVVTWPNSMSFPVDRELLFRGMSLSTLKGMREVVRMASGYDVLHVHSGINWKRADIVWLGAIRRKPMVLHYHGSETRMGYGAYFSSLGDAKVVSTPDLLDWWGDAEYVPNPAGDELFEVPFKVPSGRVRLLHIPTDRKLKGTEKVLEAVSSLKKEGLDFDFSFLEKISHSQAIKAMQSSDIIIDWISDKGVTGISGIYGRTSIEAMALGKAAVAYIGPEVRGRYPEGLAVVSPKEPTSDSLADCLRPLMTDASLLDRVMRKSRDYAMMEHGQKRIVERFDRIYASMVRP